MVSQFSNAPWMHVQRHIRGLASRNFFAYCTPKMTKFLIDLVENCQFWSTVRISDAEYVLDNWNCTSDKKFSRILHVLVANFYQNVLQNILDREIRVSEEKNWFSFHFFIFILFQSSSINEIKISLLFSPPPCPLPTVPLEPSSNLSI